MFLSVTTAAMSLGVQPWQLRNLFNRGLADEPERLGHSRIITPDQLPRLRRAAQAAGYIREGGDQ